MTMGMGLPYEATPNEIKAYRHLLLRAGQQRLAGLCVGPQCAFRPQRGALTCGGQDCLEFEAEAPEINVRHWMQLAPELDGLDATAPTAQDWRRYFLAALFGSVTGGGLVVAAFALGVWLRVLRVTA